MTDDTAPPSPPEPPDEAPDGTLGGYLSLHRRPPAFLGSDGYPYTVSMETEKTPNLLAPFCAYLVFPRWAPTGAGILGHLETPTLRECRSRQEAEAFLGSLTLRQVQALLEEALKAASTRDDPHASENPRSSE